MYSTTSMDRVFKEYGTCNLTCGLGRRGSRAVVRSAVLSLFILM